MSDHVAADDATSRWSLIIRGSGQDSPRHTRQGWSWIADAIRSADRVINDAAKDRAGRVAASAIRGDTSWCRAAVAAYDSVRAANAYGHPEPAAQGECYADEHIIRAWLDGPWVPVGDRLQTVAQVTGSDVEFRPGRLPDAAAVTTLVGLAQDAGVFGIPDHRVSLWRFFGDGSLPEHTFKVSVRPPDRPTMTSSLIGADQLLRPAREPVATIVHMLQGVAAVANQLLAAQESPKFHPPQTDFQRGAAPPPTQPGVEGHVVGARSRPFPALRLDNTNAAPDLPDQPPMPGTGRHR
jgi:hypothetical protein